MYLFHALVAPEAKRTANQHESSLMNSYKKTERATSSPANGVEYWAWVPHAILKIAMRSEDQLKDDAAKILRYAWGSLHMRAHNWTYWNSHFKTVCTSNGFRLIGQFGNVLHAMPEAPKQKGSPRPYAPVIPALRAQENPQCGHRIKILQF